MLPHSKKTDGSVLTEIRTHLTAKYIAGGTESSAAVLAAKICKGNKYNMRKKLILLAACASLLTAAAILYGTMFMEVITSPGHHTETGPAASSGRPVVSAAAREQKEWEEADTHIMDNENVENILLVGQDKREGQERQRSDSMVLVSINKDTKKINTVSFMRDMYVDIPGYGKERLNVAYLLGGTDLLDEVIEDSFGIAIDHNVEADFDGFISAFSVLGDMDIFLSKIEADYLSSGNDWMQSVNSDAENWHFEAGMNTLTPEQLLAYCRMRYLGNSDWDRTTRQRKVLKAAYEKIKDEDPITIIRVITKVLPDITTDMSKAEILGYAYTVLHDSMEIGSSSRVPADGTYSSETIDGKSVLVPDLEENAEILRNTLYGEEAEKNE